MEPNERKIIRCQECNLNQFMTVSGNCRRCFNPFPIKLSPWEPIPPSRTVEMIGTRIQQLRQSQKMSQSELSRASGVSRSFLCRIEKGRVERHGLPVRKIAKALNISMAAFLTPETALLDETFIRDIVPLLKRLPLRSKKAILERLQCTV